MRGGAPRTTSISYSATVCILLTCLHFTRWFSYYCQRLIEWIQSEGFKTRAARWENCLQRATLGKSGSEAAPQLQGRMARAFSSNSLVNTMDMTAAIQYILTAAQSLGSQVYYKKSRRTILRLAGVLSCENEQA